jgi:CRP-like cAMP-binding protein
LSDGRGVNALLTSLSRQVQEEIRPDLELVELARDAVLYREGDPIAFVYFPTDSILSIVVSVPDGHAVETMAVSHDGFLGISCYLGRADARQTAIVQIGGKALRMTVAAFGQHLESAGFRSALGYYVDRAIAGAGQATACLAFHPLEQRLARWLLLVQDRINRKDLPLTHEFLAQMLGVQRPTVTIALGLLQQEGVIGHRRGAISVIDRAGLQKLACDCYETSADRAALN